MLQSLLSSPEPKDPQDAEVAAMLLKNPAEFEHKAREWAEKYAGAPKRDEGQGSGGATAETIRKAQQQAKEKSSKSRLAE
jgi:ubiquitin-conjugating enzyme (huntingtin interacting protein 2)